MRAFLLAAGLGTRLKEETVDFEIPPGVKIAVELVDVTATGERGPARLPAGLFIRTAISGDQRSGVNQRRDRHGRQPGVESRFPCFPNSLLDAFVFHLRFSRPLTRCGIDGCQI